jgi:hypothetical protein
MDGAYHLDESQPLYLAALPRHDFPREGYRCGCTRRTCVASFAVETWVRFSFVGGVEEGNRYLSCCAILEDVKGARGSNYGGIAERSRVASSCIQAHL